MKKRGNDNVLTKNNSTTDLIMETDDKIKMMMPDGRDAKTQPKRIVMPFGSLALGARFSYIDSDRVWIKLNNHGCGTVAEYDSEMISHEKWIWQSLCSAKETDDEELMIVFVA